MDFVWIIIAGLLMLVGIAGSILPALPGSPVSYAGLLLMHLTGVANFDIPFLIIWAVIILLIQGLDYYVPIWGAKKFGGGKPGMWGSTIGIFVGIFLLPPWGIILFPFVGAVVGELLSRKRVNVALKAGFGTFLGFLAGTFAKLFVAFLLLFFYLKALYHLLAH